MGAIIHVYADDETMARLQRTADQEGRTIEELAECAVSEAALRWDIGHRPTTSQKDLPW